MRHVLKTSSQKTPPNPDLDLKDGDTGLETGKRGKRFSNSRLVALIAALAVIAVFVGGWWAASIFQSPAQREAAAGAPAPAPVTAEVSLGSLSRVVTAQGSTQRAARQTISIPSSDQVGVVTNQVKQVGEVVQSGSVVSEINGRPLIAIQGAFPFYRDLRLGDIGPDVRQLQQGLRSAGLGGTADGVFGSTTQTAVTSLYKTAGYAVPTQEVEAASDGVSTGDASSTTQTPGASANPSVTAAQSLAIPVSELIVFATSPSYLVSTPGVGTKLDETASVQVEQGAVLVTAPVASSSAGTVTAGLSGTATRSEDGASLPVTVTAVTPATEDGGEAMVTLSGVDGDLPDEWLSKQVLVSITIELVAAESLLVPTRAVVTGGKGAAHILKLRSDGTFEAIDVTENAALSGQSSITPKSADALAAGDLVRVG